MAAKLVKRIKKRISKIRNKNASYFIQENVVQGFGDLKAVLNPLPDIDPLTSTKTIAINEIPLNDITIKSVKEKFGVPSYVLKNGQNIENHKVYFFRDRVGFYKLMLQFHFINNNFFFASTKISVPKGITTERKKQIVKQALVKYTGANESKQIKELDVKITDEHNNMLFVFDYVSFYLNYLPDNETCKILYEEVCAATEEEKETEETKIDIDKYI